MRYRKLGRTGLEVSILGYGVSSMGGVFGERDFDEGQRAIDAGIAGGINYFDVAPLYGLTLAEERLGKFLKGRDRNKLIISTKCCRDTFDKVDYSGKRVKESIDESLKRLQTDYVDVYQLHDIEFADEEQIVNETFPAAREVQKSGKARFIGITGLPVRYLRKVAEQVDPDTIMSWGHHTLIEDELDEELVPLLRERNIGLMNAAPLMQNILSEQEIPEWHRAPKPVLEMSPRIVSLCRDEFGVDLAHVAMRYAYDYEQAATTVVSISKQVRVENNLKALDFEIPEGLLDRLFELVAPIKNMMWYEGLEANNIPPTDPNQYVPTNPDVTHS